jgi:hypothetical protein
MIKILICFIVLIAILKAIEFLADLDSCSWSDDKYNYFLDNENSDED